MEYDEYDESWIFHGVTHSCSECKKEIFLSSEKENQLCLRCEQRLIDHSNERREWNHFHP